jgi:hypothetical protein
MRRRSFWPLRWLGSSARARIAATCGLAVLTLAACGTETRSTLADDTQPIPQGILDCPRGIGIGRVYDYAGLGPSRYATARDAVEATSRAELKEYDQIEESQRSDNVQEDSSGRRRYDVRSRGRLVAKVNVVPVPKGGWWVEGITADCGDDFK